MPPEPCEELISDFVRIERELLCVRQGRFFGVGERPVFEVEQPAELVVRRSVPRSLRGVGAVSIRADVHSRDERRHQLLRFHRHGSTVRHRVHVRDHRLQNLRSVCIDPEHVRNVAALRSDVEIQLSDVRRHFIFRESRKSRHGRVL